MPGKFERYWEMTEGGPYDAGEHEIFKCKDCGAESEAGTNFNGEPDPSRCKAHCRSRAEDWRPGAVSNVYRRNFDRIFPDAPGARVR